MSEQETRTEAGTEAPADEAAAETSVDPAADVSAEEADSEQEQALANPVEAAAAPAGLSCSFPGRAASFKSFARQRHDIVNRTIASVDVDAGSDQTVFVGQVVQFDGRESTPEPSESVTYEWDNGMTGAYPTAVFDAPGEYEVTLTVTVRGLGFTDTCTVRVIELPAVAFRERGGGGGHGGRELLDE